VLRKFRFCEARDPCLEGQVVRGKNFDASFGQIADQDSHGFRNTRIIMAAKHGNALELVFHPFEVLAFEGRPLLKENALLQTLDRPPSGC
jgi:hypothetical protein